MLVVTLSVTSLSLTRWKVVKHYVTRVKSNLEMIEQLDMIGRTSEFARVFGIEFYHVLSRGSQVSCQALCDSCEG